MREKLSTKWIVLAVAISMLTITLPTMATHNSVGYQIKIAEPSEVSTTGELTPDIPHEDHPNEATSSDWYDTKHLNYHTQLEDLGLDARQAPIDQSGERYTDCDGPNDVTGDYAPWLEENEDEQCYIGYFDFRMQYQVDTVALLLPYQPDDLYSFNPSDDDGYCTGEDETDTYTGNPAVDQEITSLERGATSYVDGWTGLFGYEDHERCDWRNGHSMGIPGAISIDRTLLDAPVIEALETAGYDTASGTWHLPLTGTTYAFLFGEPHPKANDKLLNDEDFEEDLRRDWEEEGDPLRWSAGEGPFSNNVGAFGSPLFENWGHDDDEAPCGDRTDRCELLTHADIREYDRVQEDPELTRICGYTPQFSYAPAGNGAADRSAGACGPQATTLDQFDPTFLGGGFGIDDAPPTYVSNLPGWHWGVLFSVESAVTFPGIPDASPVDFASSPDYDRQAALDVFLRDDAFFDQGYIAIWAINPEVPLAGDSLECVAPNFLASGEDDELPGLMEDPGFYGNYTGDAIDVDLQVANGGVLFQDVVDLTHSDVRGVLGPLEDDVESLDSDVAHLEERALDQVPGVDTSTVDEASNRIGPTQGTDEVPHAQPGPDNQHPFDAKIGGGLGCGPDRTIQFNLPQIELGVQLHEDADLRAEGSEAFVNETFTVILPDASADLDVGDFPELVNTAEALVGDRVAIDGIQSVEEGVTGETLKNLTIDVLDRESDAVEEALFDEGHVTVNLTYSDGDKMVQQDIATGPIQDGEATFDLDVPSDVSGDIPLDAGVSFQASVSQETVNLKDLTVLDDDLLPAEDTDEGYWQTDQYSFSGESIGYVDFQQNGEFGSCPGANPGAGDDWCPWRPLWDAYNTDCETFNDRKCANVLTDFGYNINNTDNSTDGKAGVGLYTVIEVTGPVVVETGEAQPVLAATEDNVDQHVLGLDNPTAQNCIVGTSDGFDQFLHHHVDVLDAPGSGDFDEDGVISDAYADKIAEALCGDEHEDTAFFGNAFGDQNPEVRGFFSSTLTWTKLLPTPEASALDQGDSLCVGGIWTITDDTSKLTDQDGTWVAGDSAGENNIHLEDDTVYEFSHFQSLSTGEDTPGHQIECNHHS